MRNHGQNHGEMKPQKMYMSKNGTEYLTRCIMFIIISSLEDVCKMYRISSFLLIYYYEMELDRSKMETNILEKSRKFFNVIAKVKKISWSCLL